MYLTRSPVVNLQISLTWHDLSVQQVRALYPPRAPIIHENLDVFRYGINLTKNHDLRAWLQFVPRKHGLILIQVQGIAEHDERTNLHCATSNQ